MADESSKTVQLTPAKAVAPKLAVVTPGPKTVKVAVPKAETVPTTVVAADAPEASEMIKKGEVLDRITSQTGVKRADAKAVLEAFLSVFGDDLRDGRDLQLPPLGKVKVVKTKPVGKGATALTVKIRTPNTE